MDEVEAILSASTYYEILGATPTWDFQELRRAYLTRSVKVHPDKNNDPRATQAFQRVAEAWNVLSDEEARAAYDESIGGADGRDHAHYNAPPSPSFEEALFAFAAATSMMGSMSATGDLAQTLYWAHRLVQSRDKGGSNPTANAAGAAMAVGSGLRAVGAAAKMLGFERASVVAERTATFAQTVGVGAMVADVAKDVPAVKKALSQGGEQAKGLKGTFMDTLEKVKRERSTKP